MAHERIAAGSLCSLLALLLGALACGDGMTPVRTTSESRPAESSSPAVMSSAMGAAPSPNQPMPAPAMPAPATGSTPGEAPNPTMRGDAPPAGDPPANTAPEAQDPDAPGADDPTPPEGTPDELTREAATGPGPFEVTTLTTGLRDGPDYGSQTLYVPEGAEPPFASVAIVPGFNTPESSIQAWGPFLASHGIVALTFGTNTPTDSAELRARALLDALETLRAENTRAASPVAGQLDLERLAIMGWSLGGGGVMQAASSTPSLKAAITMAAFGPGAQFPNDQVPTLFLAGSADRSAGGQSQGMFASLPATTPKMLFEVQGGPHEIGNDPANASGEIGRYGLSWLQVFLVGDERFRQFLVETPSQASDFRQSLVSAP